MGTTIHLDHITKIEGHAKLNLSVHDGKVDTCDLSATEGARYFEGLIRGRRYDEACEITSRICGICSTAHVIGSITAIEDALGFMPSIQTNMLRILITLAERIRSHATHLYFLALPDFVGYESALAMAKKFKPELQRAISMMKAGNSMLKTFAGRDIHPVSATVGGWLHLPKQDEIKKIEEDLKSTMDAAIETCRLFFSLKVPDFTSEGDWFSIRDEKDYSSITGLFTSGDIFFEKNGYRDFLREYQTPDSTANFVVRQDRRYMVGALARINNNLDLLMPQAAKMLKESTIRFPSKNPFHNNIAQAIELVYSIERAIEICKDLKIEPEKPAKIPLGAGTGISCTEAPRGTLWHEYTLEENGTITNANIITPTAQNLLNMQEDIRKFVPTTLDKTKEEIVLEIEKLIRSYDPCFSCSAHFLEVNWE